MGTKYFGIGLSKTGTRSVATAMRLLGYRTLHKGDRQTAKLVERAAQEDVPLLTHLGVGYDAYFDVVELVTRFRTLDEQYPGSRFILTTRDVDEWLASRERHLLGRELRPDDPPELVARDVAAHRPLWIEEWEVHHRAVREHFAGRADLLEIDVAADGGWEKLAPFADARIPRGPFPWENRDGQGTYRAETSSTDRARRRARFAIARGRRRVHLI